MCHGGWVGSVHEGPRQRGGCGQGAHLAARGAGPGSPAGRAPGKRLVPSSPFPATEGRLEQGDVGPARPPAACPSTHRPPQQHPPPHCLPQHPPPQHPPSTCGSDVETSRAGAGRGRPDAFIGAAAGARGVGQRGRRGGWHPLLGAARLRWQPDQRGEAAAPRLLLATCGREAQSGHSPYGRTPQPRPPLTRTPPEAPVPGWNPTSP